MENNEKTIEVSLLDDEELNALFERVAEKNGTTGKEVLSDFMKDYIVSNGHPEQVNNGWPWNKQDK